MAHGSGREGQEPAGAVRQWWKGGSLAGPASVSAGWKALGRARRGARGRRHSEGVAIGLPPEWEGAEVFDASSLARAVLMRAAERPATEKHARWLLGFAADDLDQLTEAAWRALVAYFGGRTSPWARVGRHLQARVRTEQRWLRSGLATLAGGGEWHFPGRTEGRRRTLRVEPTGRLVTYREARAVSPWVAFRDHVFAVFSAVGRQLRSCQRCQRPFIRAKRQAYCSPHCSQAIRTKKYRAANREEFRRQRREAYQQSHPK